MTSLSSKYILFLRFSIKNTHTCVRKSKYLVVFYLCCEIITAHDFTIFLSCLITFHLFNPPISNFAFFSFQRFQTKRILGFLEKKNGKLKIHMLNKWPTYQSLSFSNEPKPDLKLKQQLFNH